jgi:hypothetical protein
MDRGSEQKALGIWDYPDDFSDYLDASSLNAASVRNYFYNGTVIYIHKDKLLPLIGWLHKTCIDVRHEGRPFRGGYLIKRDATLYPKPDWL